jgi:hypothetical protein
MWAESVGYGYETLAADSTTRSLGVEPLVVDEEIVDLCHIKEGRSAVSVGPAVLRTHLIAFSKRVEETFDHLCPWTTLLAPGAIPPRLPTNRPAYIPNHHR